MPWKKTVKLKCETNTTKMKARIRRAAKRHFKTPDVKMYFEHGQWFMNAGGVLYAANDASGPGTTDGFDFEQLP